MPAKIHRHAFKSLIAFASLCGLVASWSPAAAGPASLSRNLGNSVSRLNEGRATMAPFAAVRFCVRNGNQCRDTGGSDIMQMNGTRRSQLQDVNAAVNRAIRPTSDRAGDDSWNISSSSGDCEEFALAKRQRLIRLGWSSRSLRIAVARTPSGEGHAVLIAKTSDGDLVLDNRTAAIKPSARTDLSWVMIQSKNNPKRWVSLRR